MRENCKDIFGRERRFGVMDTFAVLLEMPARRRFATTLKVKGEKRRFIHEAEDFVVFSPPLYKIQNGKDCEKEFVIPCQW